MCNTYSDWEVYTFPFSEDYHLINTFAKQLNFSQSFFILSSESKTGISMWCQLCTFLSSSFVHGSIEVTAITGMNKRLPLFAGEVTPSVDIWKMITAAGAIGCHHCCSFKKAEDSLTLWNLSVFNEENKLDRGWDILKEILRLKRDKTTVVSYENCELAKSMQRLINGRAASTVFLADASQEVFEMARYFQKVFRDEKEVTYPSNSRSVQEMNALKNELFVMENDVDAYEDEIRRQHRTIEDKNRIISSLQHQSFFVC